MLRTPQVRHLGEQVEQMTVRDEDWKYPVSQTQVCEAVRTLKVTLELQSVQYVADVVQE